MTTADAPGTDGHGPKPEQRVRLKDVAARLGLSPATVSLVMNRSPAAKGIPPETQERVRAAAEELGYRPNFIARSLRRQRTFAVGVLLPEISEGYAAGVLGGIEDELLREGYFYLVAGHHSKPDLFEDYLELLTERAVEGLILVNTPIDRSPPLPAVVVAGHRELAGVTNVVLDHQAAARLALGRLTALGHRRIAFFKGHRHSADTEPRWRAIVAAAADLGIEIDPRLTLRLSGGPEGEQFSPEEGYREGHAFGRKLLAVGAPFTALFAFNDVSAIGAMRALVEAGLRIPEDVSVVGFDDILSAAFQTPSLTTVRQPLHEMGQRAAAELLRKLGRPGEGSPAAITIEPTLVVRDSTGPAADLGRETGRGGCSPPSPALRPSPGRRR